MSWIDTLDRLIADSWMASRDESAAMLDSLLALSLVERWDLFVTRDARLLFLSDEDYTILFRSLNAHTMMAQVNDDALAENAVPVTEEATEVLPDEMMGGAEAEEYEQAQREPDFVHEELSSTGFRAWMRSRTGLRFLALGVVCVVGMMMVGAFISLVVLYLLPSGKVPLVSENTAVLTSKLVDVERDQVQLAKRLIHVDNRLSDLAVTVDDRFGTAMRAVSLTSNFDQLQAAVERGGSYATELARLAPYVAGNSAMEEPYNRLDFYALGGVPSILVLRDRFDEMAQRLGGVIGPGDSIAVRAVDTEQETGVVARLFGWIAYGFGMAESAESKRFRAALAGVRANLGLGNLAIAVRQIKELQPNPVDLVTRWLVVANLRLEVDKSLAVLRQIALHNLPAAPDPPAAADQ